MKKLVCCLLIATLALFTTSVEALAQTGWTWRGNIFPSSFSPSGYYSGYWNYGNYQVFGGQMYWDSTRASNIRNIYAPQGFRYTHDITDLNNNLGYSGWYATNFPNPKFDTDNNQWWDAYISEETEVTANSTSFPQNWQTYYFMVEMRRGGNGPFRTVSGGTVNHTPAISKKFVWSSEWQTMDYERRPYKQVYPWASSGSPALTNILENSGIIEKPSKTQAQKDNEVIVLRQPLTIKDFTEETRSLTKPLKSFVLEFEVENEFGTEIMSIGGTPDDENIVPMERVQRMLSLLPESNKVISFRGVVRYELEAEEENR